MGPEASPSVKFPPGLPSMAARVDGAAAAEALRELPTSEAEVAKSNPRSQTNPISDRLELCAPKPTHLAMAS